ncbi:MAG: methylated-DNA--[protein]-cysteine S-methyltransferase [Thermoplasmata archaeon]
MGDRVEFADVTTPIGTFRIVYQEGSVRIVDLLENGLPQSGLPPGANRRKPPYARGSPPRQLQEYFRGERTDFEVVVDPDSASDFDRKVWGVLREVPAGRTVTYGELARRSGFVGAARAVGGAMRRNPIPIVIPCHRVVGEGGAITGFGLGLWRKRWLLDHEGSWPLRSRSAEGPRPHGQRTLDAGVDRPPRKGRTANPTTGRSS